jgi:uncharacterized protein YdaU (DUF1376 family)
MSKKCKPIWMPLYIEKFLADTAHLTAAQCGALINLLCAMWRSDDGTLPDDAEMLTRISKVHPPHWNRTWKAIKSLFDIDGDRVTNPDLQRELGMANAKIVTNRAAGALGGRTTKWKRTLRPVDNSIHTPTMNAIHTPTMTAPKPLKNNDVGAANAVANGVANYNYNIKEKEESSVSTRPGTVEPSLKEGFQEREKSLLMQSLENMKRLRKLRGD